MWYVGKRPHHTLVSTASWKCKPLFSTAGRAGIPPCWDAHGCGLESSFLLTSWNFFFFFELRLAVNSSDVREKVISETGRDLVR